MRRLLWIGCVIAIVALISPIATFAEDEREKKHARELGLKSEAALKNLFAAVPDAEAAFNKSVGWAYFDMKAEGEAAVLRPGGGTGVAMTAGSRSGMPMSGTTSEAREQAWEYIFFFSTKEAFDSFVDGWDPGGTQKATARNAGLKVDAPFVLGVKVYALVESEPVEEANIATAKFRKGFARF